jgi:hypothetical protein
MIPIEEVIKALDYYGAEMKKEDPNPSHVRECFADPNRFGAVKWSPNHGTTQSYKKPTFNQRQIAAEVLHSFAAKLERYHQSLQDQAAAKAYQGGREEVKE